MYPCVGRGSSRPAPRRATGGTPVRERAAETYQQNHAIESAAQIVRCLANHGAEQLFGERGLLARGKACWFLVPRKAPLTRAVPVAEGRPAAAWAWAITGARRFTVAMLRPRSAASLRKAATVSGIAGRMLGRSSRAAPSARS